MRAQQLSYYNDPFPYSQSISIFNICVLVLNRSEICSFLSPSKRKVHYICLEKSLDSVQTPFWDTFGAFLGFSTTSKNSLESRKGGAVNK